MIIIMGFKKIFSRVVKGMSFFGLIGFMMQALLVNRIDTGAYGSESYPLTLVQFMAGVILFWLLPYWLGYSLDPNPEKGFLLKRWKI